MEELTLEILDEAMKQLPPVPVPRGLKISFNDFNKMIDALERVVQVKYIGTFIYPSRDMEDGTYEFIW